MLVVYKPPDCGIFFEQTNGTEAFISRFFQLIELVKILLRLPLSVLESFLKCVASLACLGQCCMVNSIYGVANAISSRLEAETVTGFPSRGISFPRISASIS